MNGLTYSTAEAVGAFAHALFAPDDIVEIRRLPSGSSTWHRASELHGETERLRAQNGRGANIYVGANPRRSSGSRGDRSIDLARSLFVDFDHCSVGDALAKAESARLPRPTIVVNSGHGCHAYWRLDEPLTELAVWTECQKELIALVGSDPSIHNPERIMRLPGFLNNKPPAAPCKLVSADAAVSCALADLRALLPPAESAVWNRPTRAAPDAIASGSRNSTLTSLAGSMRRQGMGGDAIYAALRIENANRCRPPLDAAEVRAIADSVARYEPTASRQWPERIADAAMHGLAGEIVRAIDPHTEAAPVAVLSHVLVAAGNVVGRSAYIQVGGARHHLNLNVCNVGDTSTGRKGTAWAEVRRVFQGADPTWAAERQLGGLSSGEGLIWAVRDAIYRMERDRKTKQVEPVLADPGVADKRLLVIESELASVMRVMARETNTLSMIVRQAWDGLTLNTMTKNSPAKATDPHVSMLGHITPDELRRELNCTEMANGFANRWLWFMVRRSKLLPDGGRLPPEVLEGLQARLRKVVADATPSVLGELRRDEDANTMWHAVYGPLTAGRPGLLGAVTGRAAPQVLRLSGVYAVLDGSAIIRPEHLSAALAVWEYGEASAKYLFGSSLGDRVADEILRALRACPEGMTRTDLRDHFGRNRESEQIGRALGLLNANGLAFSRQEDTGGRSAERWFAGQAATTETT